MIRNLYCCSSEGTEIPDFSKWIAFCHHGAANYKNVISLYYFSFGNGISDQNARLAFNHGLLSSIILSVGKRATSDDDGFIIAI